jgi:hypothetical protein
MEFGAVEQLEKEPMRHQFAMPLSDVPHRMAEGAMKISATLTWPILLAAKSASSAHPIPWRFSEPTGQHCALL